MCPTRFESRALDGPAFCQAVNADNAALLISNKPPTGASRQWIDGDAPQMSLHAWNPLVFQQVAQLFRCTSMADQCVLKIAADGQQVALRTPACFRRTDLHSRAAGCPHHRDTEQKQQIGVSPFVALRLTSSHTASRPSRCRANRSANRRPFLQGPRVGAAASRCRKSR